MHIETLKLYYYATDLNYSEYIAPATNVESARLPSSEFKSDRIIIYDENFINVGILSRNIYVPYIENMYFEQYTQTFIIGENKDTITVAFNYVVGEDGEYYPGGTIIPFTYLYGTGKYFNKKITGFLLPYDNKVKSREYVFYIEEDE